MSTPPVTPPAIETVPMRHVAGDAPGDVTVHQRSRPSSPVTALAFVPAPGVTQALRQARAIAPPAQWHLV